MVKTKPQNGFTLVELMLTVGILAILTATAIPRLGVLLQNNSLTSNTNDFITALNFTRSEAIKRGTRVTLCHANAAQTNCDNTNAIWENGWIIFTGGVVAPVLNTVTVAGPTIIRVQEKLPNSNVKIGGRPVVTSYVSYNGRGAAQHFNGLSQASSFTVCDKRTWTNSGADARIIVINSTGRISSMLGNDPRNTGSANPILACLR